MEERFYLNLSLTCGHFVRDNKEQFVLKQILSVISTLMLHHLVCWREESLQNFHCHVYMQSLHSHFTL